MNKMSFYSLSFSKKLGLNYIRQTLSHHYLLISKPQYPISFYVLITITFTGKPSTSINNIMGKML